MKLKDLIKFCSYKKVFNYIYKRHYSNYSHSKAQQIDLAFLQAWTELSQLESKKETQDQIYVINAQSDFAEDEQDYIDVCLYSKQDDQLYAIDFVDWQEIIDCEIKDGCNFADKNELASYILFEITFWGFSTDDIKKESRKLSDSIKEVAD